MDRLAEFFEATEIEAGENGWKVYEVKGPMNSKNILSVRMWIEEEPTPPLH